MLTHLIAVLTLAALVAGWFLLSRWIARTDPDLPGINRRCGGCSGTELQGERDGERCHDCPNARGEPRARAR